MPLTDPFIFDQRTRLGRVIYRLEGHELFISGKRGFVRIQLHFDLRAMSPAFERRNWRSSAVIALSFSMSLFFALGTWLLRRADVIPYALVFFVGGSLATASFISGFQSLSWIELATFRSKSGIPLFDVMKGADQADEFEKFVARLSLAAKEAS